jgi:hypothetical protein
VFAYFSHETKAWVRLEKLEDNEYCHSSGYPSRLCALLGSLDSYSEPPLRSFLLPEND